VMDIGGFFEMYWSQFYESEFGRILFKKTVLRAKQNCTSNLYALHMVT
jgi:hypothetical protein